MCAPPAGWAAECSPASRGKGRFRVPSATLHLRRPAATLGPVVPSLGAADGVHLAASGFAAERRSADCSSTMLRRERTIGDGACPARARHPSSQRLAGNGRGTPGCERGDGMPSLMPSRKSDESSTLLAGAPQGSSLSRLLSLLSCSTPEHSALSLPPQIAPSEGSGVSNSSKQAIGNPPRLLTKGIHHGGWAIGET